MRKGVLVSALCLLLAPLSYSLATRFPILVPRESAELNFTHVPFRWTPTPFVNAYQLQVVEDRGTADPFRGSVPIVDMEVPPAEPRALVTSGLRFGKAYAWRVRGLREEPIEWGATHRFSIVPLPRQIPDFAVTKGPAAGPMEPGLTLFSLGGLVAVDSSGNPVWFLGRGGHDVRMLPNGHISFISFEPPATGRVIETSMDGRVIWASPQDASLDVHHEASAMPNGNFLALVHEIREVLRDGKPLKWKGDRIVEFDRRTGSIVWSWSTFDHYSTLDFDAREMAKPDSDGSYDWTHSNAAIYDPKLNSVYISVRHLSRISRIDYSTGRVVYNMGMEMPSGDVAFGNGLFSFQHTPNLLANGNMMVYDNGNRPLPSSAEPVSRAIEIRFEGGDPPSSASIVWEYRLPIHNPSAGDADRLPGGNTLIVAGGPDDPSMEEFQKPGKGRDPKPPIEPEQLARLNTLSYLAGGSSRPGRRELGRPQPHKLLEVNPSGALVWTLELIETRTAPVYRIYRAERIPRLIMDTPGDADGDWDLDQLDARALKDCFTGPGSDPVAFPCTLSDLDSDGDVDCRDWEVFTSAWAGPGKPPRFSRCDPAEAPAPGQGKLALGGIVLLAGAVSFLARSGIRRRLSGNSPRESAGPEGTSRYRYP